MRTGIDEATLQQVAFLATFKERLESKETEAAMNDMFKDELVSAGQVFEEPKSQ